MRVSSLIVSNALAASTSAVTLPTITTTQGYLRGSISNFRSGATSYKGIPYAAPPVGDLRWKAPEAASSWNGTLNATEFGPQCAQPSSSAGIFSSGKESTSEDCLTLNIWTPTYDDISVITSKNLPVYVWIFGGRFEGGSGDVKTYDGSGLAVKDVIVVTLNYRLGSLVFIAHTDLSAESAHNSTGNYALMDQQLALRWVQDNIRNFGGNPNQVVVGGQSAGSASALDVMYSNLTKGLVNGVIAESGARAPRDPMTGSLATSHRTMSAALAQGETFLTNSLNVSSIAEARELSYETLIEYGSLSDTTFDDTIYKNLSSAFMDPPLWRPVIDGYVLPHTYGEALRLGAHLDVPILTGNNKDESGAAPSTTSTVADYIADFTEMFGNYSASFLKLWPAGDNSTSAADQMNTFFRDLARVSTWVWGNEWAAGGAKSDVYVYYWTHTPEENPSQGAYHGSELWYTFNNIPYADYSNVTWDAEDYAIEEKMAQYWVNFISTGNPNGNGTGNLTQFPPSTSNKKQVMWLGNSWGSGYLTETEERRQFIVEWLSSLYEY
jgi:carboxylesterase 2